MSEERTDAVALPPSGDGSRRARRSPGSGRRRRSRARRHLLRPLALGLGGLLAVVAAVLGVMALVDDGDDGPGAPPEVLAPRPPASSTGLLLQRGADGALVAAALLVVDGSGRGGEVVHVPPGTMLESASLGLVPLRDVAEQGDVLVRDTISNLLGTQVEVVVALDPAQLAAAVGPAGALRVEVPERVEGRDGDVVETVFPAGPAEVPPEQVIDLLALPASTDLARMVRHQAFWTAWLDVLGDRVDARPPEDVLGPLAGPLAELAAGDVRHQVLPVAAVGGVEELYRVDQQALDQLVTETLPGTPRSGERVTVQVLNGTGRPGAAQDLLAPLVGAGARVSLTGNADRFDYAVSQIVFHDEAHAGDARRLRDALGFGEAVRSRTPTGAVDLTVVLGADFPASS